MKTLRLVLGILSIIFAFFMLLSSCAGSFTGGLTNDENLTTSSSLCVPLRVVSKPDISQVFIN